MRNVILAAALICTSLEGFSSSTGSLGTSVADFSDRAARSLFNNRKTNFCVGLFQSSKYVERQSPKAMVEHQSLAADLAAFADRLKGNSEFLINRVQALSTHSQAIGVDFVAVASRIQDVVNSLDTSIEASLKPVAAVHLPTSSAMQSFLSDAKATADRVALLAQGGHRLQRGEPKELETSIKYGLPALAGYGAAVVVDALSGFSLFQDVPVMYAVQAALVPVIVLGLSPDKAIRVYLKRTTDLQSLEDAYKQFTEGDLEWSYWSRDIQIPSSLARRLIDPKLGFGESSIQLANLAETESFFHKWSKWRRNATPFENHDRLFTVDVLMRKVDGQNATTIVLRSNEPLTYDESKKLQ